MTGYIASTRASYYLTTLLLQVVLTEWSYIVPQVPVKLYTADDQVPE